jgi:hypothetical protein
VSGDLKSESKFSGYGITTANTQVTATVRVRLVEISTGAVRVSKVTKGTATFLSTAFGGVENSDVAYAVIEAALESLRSDEEFRAAVAGDQVSGVARRVRIRIEPTPANCDIEIDGSYVGSSPMEYEAAIGEVLKIELSKGDYTTWSKSVRVHADLRITPELSRKNTGAGEGKRESSSRDGGRAFRRTGE